MEDRQYCAIALWVEELVRVPASRERPGLGLAVADDAANEEIRVVKCGAVGVHQRVAKLAALVDRAGRLRRDMARDAARERELPKQGTHAVRVIGDVRIGLAVGALEVRIGDQAGTSMPRTRHVERVQVVLTDCSVHVRVDEVQSRRGPPVTEQPRLDVLGQQRLAQQRIVEQVDLPDRQVVGRAPVGVQEAKLITAIAGHRLHRRITAPASMP
jgi:hypothetical protein